MQIRKFEIENELDNEVTLDYILNKYLPDEWNEFIFFCVIPFTQNEFERFDGSLLNPDTLRLV